MERAGPPLLVPASLFAGTPGEHHLPRSRAMRHVLAAMGVAYVVALSAAQYGGDGATLREAGRVAEVLGECLATVPYLSAGILAPTLLAELAVGDRTPESARAGELLSRIADGAVVAVA